MCCDRFGDKTAEKLFIKKPWFLCAAALHDAVPQGFHLPPYRGAPTEHFERPPGFEIVSGKAQMPKRPAAGVAASLHADIDRQTAADGAIGAKPMALDDLALRVENRVR